MTRYTYIADGVEAKIVGGKLYVRITNYCYGMLVQGGRVNRVIWCEYSGTMQDAKRENCHGVSDIARLIDNDNNGVAHVCRKGRLIE